MKDSARKAMFAKRRKGEENYSESAVNVKIGEVQQSIISHEQPRLKKFENTPFIGNNSLFDGKGNEVKISSNAIRYASIKHDVPVRFAKLSVTRLADKDNGSTFANQGVHL